MFLTNNDVINIRDRIDLLSTKTAKNVNHSHWILKQCTIIRIHCDVPNSQSVTPMVLKRHHQCFQIPITDHHFTQKPLTNHHFTQQPTTD